MEGRITWFLAFAIASILVGCSQHAKVLSAKTVTVEILHQYSGIGGEVSRDGSIVAIQKEWRVPMYSDRGGDWREVEGLPTYDRAWISWIGPDKTVYGGYEVGRVTNSFRALSGGKAELHWPLLDGRDYVVIGGSQDGQTLIANGRDPDSAALITATGEVELLETSDAHRSSWAADVDEQGRSVSGSVSIGSEHFASRWQGTKLIEVHRAPTTGLGDLTSGNGKFRFQRVGDEYRLYDGERSEVVWREPPVQLVESEPGAKVFRVLQIRSLDAEFVSNDGKWLIATRISGQHGEDSDCRVWQRGQGWISFEDFLQQYGGKMPAGWQLVGVRGYSRNGTTLTGIVKQGDVLRPVVIRFR